jgi:hypothetical protein|tara:strand:+ start:2652 stop:3038 length:387 start_codon:yes stop_codon:yes gene_type:complete
MKTKITDLAKRFDVSVDELLEIKQKKLTKEDWTGRGKGTWFTEDGVEKVFLELEAPDVLPELLYGTFLHEAPNDRWVYAKIEGVDGKTAVLIPRKLRAKLKGKKFPIHAITDNRDTTYRHAALTGYNL